MPPAQWCLPLFKQQAGKLELPVEAAKAGSISMELMTRERRMAKPRCKQQV
jgi:hypothetical protein